MSSHKRASRLLRFTALVLLAILLGVQLGASLPSTNDKTPSDLSSLISSGQAAARGQDPYAVYEGTSRWVRFGQIRYGPNRNGPISVLILEQFSAVDPRAIAPVWWGISLLCFLAGLYLLKREHAETLTSLVIVWALSLSGVWSTLDSGQIYLCLFIIAIGGYGLTRHGHDIAAGILFGLLCAIKPNFLVLPVLLLLAGHKRIALASLVTLVALALAPILRYGPEIYRQWFAVLPSDQWMTSPDNVSVFGAAARLGIDWAGWCIAGLVLLVAAVLVLRWRPDISVTLRIALILAVFASPVAWDGYLLFALPAFVAQGRWGIRLFLAGVLFAVPVSVPMYYGEISMAGLALTGLIYPLGLVLLLWVSTQRIRPLPPGIPAVTGAPITTA